MKRIINLLVLPLVVFACKPSGNGANERNEPGSIKNPGAELQLVASEFPSSKLEEVVQELSQQELARVVQDGESANWKRTQLDANTGTMVIQNKLANDNSIRFKLYGRTAGIALIAVQQVNAQVSLTEVWEYHYNTNERKPEQWNQFRLPDYKLDDFFDDRIELPAEFQNQSARFYLDYQLTPASINVTFNKWRYMREMESDSLAAEGPMDPMLVKYMHVFKWNGSAFDEEKVVEPGYNDELTFTSRIKEPVEGGPGPHEFDCGHGVSLTASSTLPKQGAYNYKASNVTDPSDKTAWSEGVETDGVGEWLEFTLTSNYRVGDAWQISNGYTRTKETWQQNNRVKKFKVLVDDQVVGHVILANVSAYQYFNIAPSWLKNAPPFRKGTRIRFVIEEVYKGSSYNDTAISYFVPVGNCG